MRSRSRRSIALILATLITILSTIPASAVQVSAKSANPTNLEELFDADFYAYKYPEVAVAVGNTEKALFNHFVENGINEGKTCSPYLNVTQYRANYLDVAQTFDHHWDDIVNHYFTNGIKEGRQSFVSAEDLAIKNALQAVENANAQTNGSAILGSIDSAILDAADSSTGYVKDSKTGIIASADGYALVPFEMVQKEGRIQDIDELARRCGNDLVLIRDSNNRIKFVGGRFSSVLVKDESSALSAIDTMADLYKFDTNRNYLKLSSTGKDSLGNPFYRFVSVDSEDGAVNSNYTVTLSADKDGNVLGASNANSSSLDEKIEINDASEGWGNGMQAYYEDPANGYKKLYNEPKLVYDDENKRYLWAYYYEAGGLVFEALVNTVDTSKLFFTRCYDAETFHENPSKSFNGDHNFKNLTTLTEKSFIDFYGNEVKLSVAKDEKGWYIVDTKRNMLCVESSKNDNYADISMCPKHYFSDEYFNAVNDYLNGEGDDTTLLDQEKTLISALTTLQMTYDENKSLGMLEKPKTIYVNYIYDDTSDNASHCTYNGAIEFTVNNNEGNADFAGMAHEFGHAVVANQGQSIPYRAATGAINESYADIIGSLVKMIKKKEDRYAGHVDFERWLLGEFLGNDTEHVVRNMSNPYLNRENGPSPIKVTDQYFIEDPGTYSGGKDGNDFGGVHQNNSILTHICYRMYDEVFADKGEDGHGIPDENKYRDLLKVWYDSVIFLNHDSTYADVKGYVLQAMKNHGYSEESVKQTEKIFNDADVDAYKPFDAQAKQETSYDDSDLAAAAKVEAKIGGNKELTNLINGKIASDDLALDYEIAYDELQLAKIKGITGSELKEYENQLEIAYNAFLLSENNVKELQNSFNDSQQRLKKMVDDKMAIIENQEKVLKQVKEEKENNPNLESSYKALRKGLKNNVDQVDSVIDAVEEAATELKGLDEISDVFSDVWNINDENLVDDEGLGYPDEMPEDLYIGGEYPEGLDAWDYYDFWDDFWDAYWEDDYDDWYGNFLDWDDDFNYYDENYSDEDYFWWYYDDGSYGDWNFDDWDFGDWNFDDWDFGDWDFDDWDFSDYSDYDDGGASAAPGTPVSPDDAVG